VSRFRTGRSVTLNHTFLDDETALTPEAVTVTITRDGVVDPVTSGSATANGPVYTYTPGVLPEGCYSSTWDGGPGVVDVERFEVTGGFLFSIPEVRASDPDLTQAKYPAATIRAAREDVEAEFQRITSRSFVPRTAVVELVAGGGDPVPVSDGWDSVAFTPASDEVVVPFYDVRSVTIDGVPQAVSRFGAMATVTLPEGTYTAEVAYGFTAVPNDIRRVGLLLVKHYLAEPNSGIPDRATTFQPTDGGTYTLATAGRAGYETGLPDVDAVLKDYTFEIVNDVTGGL
jgi:hypothetical protein